MELMITSSPFPECCKVCNSANAERHFGAACCKACAAFFRRFVNSKKRIKPCSCGPTLTTSSQSEKQKLCRTCRIEKCLAAGMNKCGVQFRKNAISSQSVDSPMTVESKDSDRIMQLKTVYDSLQYEREHPRNLMESPWKFTIKIMTAAWRDDARTMWKICERAFPELQYLPSSETKKMLCNFYPKWFGFNLAVTATRAANCQIDLQTYSTPPIHTYYELDAPKLLTTSACLERIFSHYWKFYISSVLKPIQEMKLDDVEIMAIMALLFMDSRYTNLSEEVHETCCNFEKVTKTQLRNYYRRTGKPIDRLFEIMNSLVIIEKLDEKTHEEIQLCAVHGITIDNDCLQIINISKI